MGAIVGVVASKKSRTIMKGPRSGALVQGNFCELDRPISAMYIMQAYVIRFD